MFVAAEGAPVGGRCGAHHGVEASAEVGGRGQADSDRDRLHGEIRFLQKDLGGHDALLEQPSARADAELAA